MADAFNTMTTLTGLHKEIYGEGPVEAVANFAYLQKNIPFEERAQVGNKYHFPVVLSQEQGFTYSKNNNGAFTLNESIPAEMGDAQVEPSQILLKSTIDYESAFRSAKGGKKAFKDGVGLVVENMRQALQKRVEIELLYGRTGLGAVNAGTTSATTFVISQASWSPGIWSGMKGADLMYIDPTFATARDTSEILAVGVNLNTRTVTTPNAQTLTAADLVFFKGQVEAAGTPVHHSMVGIDKMCTTTSGTLFNISGTTYPDTWLAAPEQTSSGQLTMAKIMAGVSEVVNRGCMEDLVALVSPKAYEVLNSDMAALRRLDASYRFSKVDSGANALTFHGQNGKLEIVPHLFVKWGDVFIFPPSNLVRIGSTDVTFKRPNTAGGESEIYRESTSSAGFELRGYTAQAIVPKRLSWMIKLSGVTYS